MDGLVLFLVTLMAANTFFAFIVYAAFSFLNFYLEDY